MYLCLQCSDIVGWLVEGNRYGITPVKNWASACCWWRSDWSSRHFAPCWRAFDMSNKYYLLTYLLSAQDFQLSPLSPPSSLAAAESTMVWHSATGWLKLSSILTVKIDSCSFYRATLCVSAAVFVCAFVRLSVTFVYCIETAKYIIRLFYQPGSPIILVFFEPKRCYSLWSCVSEMSARFSSVT